MSALFNIVCTDEDDTNLDAVIKADNPAEAIELWRAWAKDASGQDEDFDQFKGKMVKFDLKDAPCNFTDMLRVFLIDPYGVRGVLGWDQDELGGKMEMLGVIYP